MAEQEIKPNTNEIKIRNFTSLIGQTQVNKTMQMNINAYFKARAKYNRVDIRFGPGMFVGPSGTGKDGMLRG